VIVDGIVAAHPSIAPLARLVGAGLWSRSFAVFLAGRPGVVAALAGGGLDLRGEHAPEIPIPPLERAAIPAYFRRWIDATLDPGAAPILVSPDALRLLALRSEGEVERVHCIAENMLVLAAAGRRRTVTSWEAWAASDGERWAEADGSPELPRRMEGWPPPEVADVLDACRRGAGLPPWPRAGARR
jgi:hypothetical protein